MPSWTARLNLGSPQSSKPSPKPKSQGPAFAAHDQSPAGQTLQDLPLHGVPVLASPARPTTSRHHSQQAPQHGHGRSHSNPLIAMFGNGQANGRAAGSCDSFIGHHALPDGQSDGYSQDTEKDFATGSCATCDTHVRWPRTLDTFRCTVCLMINDLKPTVGGASEQRTANSSPQANCSKVPFVSLDLTLKVIDDCVKQYLSMRLRQDGGHETEAQSTSAAGQVNHSIPLPTRAPPPPPGVTAPACSKFVPNDTHQESADSQRTIFRNLENYIFSCFSGVDCLNASFLTSDRPPVKRAMSESAIMGETVDLKPEAFLDLSGPISEIDAKTLLLGDFAENGTWWTGKGTTGRHQPCHIDPMPHEEDVSHRATSKSPCINWRELNEWYSVVFTAGSSWRKQLSELVKSDPVAFNRSTPELYQIIDEEISEAGLHVQQIVSKASELLLKRPGRPLRRPEDCRFLLLLLGNPLLYSSKIIRPLPTPTDQRVVPIVQCQSSSLKPPSPTLRNPSSSSRRSPSTGGATGRHAGIIKRILGLLSTLSVECHQYLISWFSRLEESHFRRIVELVGGFVSYRLSRQHGRKRSNAQDPSGYMVPSISRLGAGNPGQLHAALGATTAPKSPEKHSSAGDYTEDWQVKAAARTMSLLFSANNNDPSVRSDSSTPSGSKGIGRTRTGSFAKKRTHRRGQLLPTSAFYNTMLDYADLIADFDTWESRKRDKFTFCQYPMFLSIWAKIRILEYDARRQMEIMARDAFFNSILSRKAVNQYLVLKVRRACLVEDSLRGVSEVVGTGQEEIKKGLRIEFIGEEGLDSGGLRKEWFLLLVRDIFDPEHGLFVYDDDSRYCYFNPNTFETSDQFYLVGVLLGLAIYNSTILDVALPPFAFRKLLASAPSYTGPTTSSSRPTSGYSLDDLAEYQPALAQGLRQLLTFEGDVETTYCWDFVAIGNRYGQPTTVPLCPNGEQRPVTNSNRREFVDLYVRYLLDTSVARQYEPFKRGFFSVCGGNALTLFRPEEIELLVRGSEEPLDVATLRSVAIYENWGKDVDAANEPAVSWFWEAFSKAQTRDQRKLLSFITASDRIPAMGATSLVIKLVCLGEHQERFPIARTCFNMIALYKYQTQEKLEEKLWRAVADSEGFGMK